MLQRESEGGKRWRTVWAERSVCVRLRSSASRRALRRRLVWKSLARHDRQYTAAMLVSRAPCHRHFTFHADAVAGLQSVVHAASVETKAPFKHVDDCSSFAKSVDRDIDAANGKLDDLRHEPEAVTFGVQRRHFDGVHRAPFTLEVRLAGDRECMVRGLGKEVAHAHPIDASDGGERGQSGNHTIGLELGKQRRGEAGFGGQARERQALAGAQRTQLEADAIGFQRPLRVGNSPGHKRLRNLSMETENKFTSNRGKVWRWRDCRPTLANAMHLNKETHPARPQQLKY